MSSAKDPHSILNRNPELGKFQVPKPKPKITRYFPGKAPEWEKEENSDEDIFPGEYELKSIGDTSITSEKMNKRLALLEELNKKEVNHGRNEERVVTRSEVIEKKTNDIQKIDETREIKAKIKESGVEIVGSKEREERRAVLKARLLAKEGESQNIVNTIDNNDNNYKKDNNADNSNKEIAVQRINSKEIRMESEENLQELDEDEQEEGFEEEEEMEEENEEEGGIINILKPIYVKKNERSGMADKLVVCKLI